MTEIHSRRVWSLSTGRWLDDCQIVNVDDATVHRPLSQPDDTRAEIPLKGALKLFERTGPDIAEIFSQPRVCQEASGQQLTPGWSLDLGTGDPATGIPWDLSILKVQDRVRQLVGKTQPYCVIG